MKKKEIEELEEIFKDTRNSAIILVVCFVILLAVLTLILSQHSTQINELQENQKELNDRIEWIKGEVRFIYRVFSGEFIPEGWELECIEWRENYNTTNITEVWVNGELLPPKVCTKEALVRDVR